MRVLAIPVTILCVVVSGPAGAENAPPTPIKAGPVYQSAFAGYRGFKDEPVKAWTASNDEMRRLGGHMGHANDSPANSGVLPAGREPHITEKPATGSKP